jgi:sugar/nucleoside kinase (ribokinase family)
VDDTLPSMPAFDLLVLGDVNPDLVLRGGDVEPAFGQAEHLVEEAHLTVGGSGAILACAAAKIGLRVVVCGVVGDDLFGRYMCEELERRGVDTSGLITDPRYPTGVSVVLSGAVDRAILTMPGTVGELRVDRVDPARLADARHVHVSSFFLQRGIRADLPAIFDRVREAGGTTSVDPNWDPSGRWDGGLLELLDRTDVFFPNAVEATRVSRTSDVGEAIDRLSARAGVVVVKKGELGAAAASGNERATVPGFDVPVVDTTGAGDAFDAGFLAGWLGGEPLERTLALANVCGALSTRAVGGVDGQVSIDEAIATLGRGSAG